MLYRSHRGGLAESMDTIIEVNSLRDIYDHEELSRYGISNNLKIKYYCYDPRIGWDTYIVSSKEYGVLGFTNGIIPKRSNQ